MGRWRAGGRAVSEVYRAFGGFGVLAVEEGGVADAADAEAAAFVGDLGAEGGAFVAVETEEAKFDELVGAELFLQFGEEGGGEAALAEFEGGLEGLAAAAEQGALGAGQRKVIHGKKRDEGRSGERR